MATFYKCKPYCMTKHFPPNYLSIYIGSILTQKPAKNTFTNIVHSWKHGNNKNALEGMDLKMNCETLIEKIVLAMTKGQELQSTWYIDES